ncbi:MAG: hypothetical protein ACXVBF_13125, partial [Flavisolibacter sp.]
MALPEFVTNLFFGAEERVWPPPLEEATFLFFQQFRALVIAAISAAYCRINVLEQTVDCAANLVP